MTFNRTSMELKPDFAYCVGTRVARTFNRTSMELKRAMSLCGTTQQSLLIEPVWN